MPFRGDVGQLCKQAHFGEDPHEARGAACSKRNAVPLQGPVISLYAERFTKHEKGSDSQEIGGKKEETKDFDVSAADVAIRTRDPPPGRLGNAKFW